jgi:hypothetical protein
MSNSNLPANILNMAQALATSVAQAGANTNTDAFMKFTKTGEWVFGAEGIVVEDDSIWAINPLGFVHGWTAWGSKDRGNAGQNAGEVMVPATQPMPLESALPAVNGDWQKAIGIQMVCTTGDDEGVQTMFKSNSHGGRKAYAALVQAVLARIASGEGTVMPLAKLKADSYKHKEYGQIFNPIIEVTGWADHTKAEHAPVEAAAPQVTLTAPPAAEEPKAPEAPAAEEPRRRRRRAV